MIKVSALDDHPVVLNGIARMLEGVADIELLPFFKDIDSLLRYFSRTLPDVLLLDLILPGIEPQNLADFLRTSYPTIKILVLSNVDHPLMAYSLLSTGISGYLLKDCDKYMLLEAIRGVFNGSTHIDPTIKGKLSGFQRTDGPNNALLSSREQKILSLIARENTNNEIAKELHLSIKRVEAIRKDLYIKLGVTSIAGLVRKAIQMGWIE